MNARWVRLVSLPAIRLTVARSTLVVALLANTGSAFAHGPGDVRSNPKVEVEGVLEHLHQDFSTGSRDFYFLESTSGERLSLHFATDPPRHLLTGTRIRVRGRRAGQTLWLDTGSTSVQTLSTTSTTVLPNTFGAQRTLIILANFQDNPTSQPWTLDHVRSVIFGTTSSFFLEGSYQQTWLIGDVYGWYTVPVNSTVCDPAFTGYADSAATAAGVDLSAYTHYVYVTPYNSGCGFEGSATVGGNPSRALINGYLELGTVGHELGHNLGLSHSHSLVCGDGTSISSDCRGLEYGDGIDIMGWSDSAHFNAFQKERLGWLNHGVSPPITTVQTGGTYVLDPYEVGGPNAKALKILKNTNLTTGYNEWYYVEFRQPLGFDSIIVTGTRGGGLDSSNILNGVVIHVGSEDNGTHNALLDMTPETYQLYSLDPALTLDRTFSDPDAGVTITPVSVGSTGATVSVALSAPACRTRSTPTVALSPSRSQAVPAGTPVTYTASVTNNDGGGCPASSFSLQAWVPSGWTAAFAAPTLTLSPGASTTTTLTVTSPTLAAAAYYNVTAVVTNGTYTQYAGRAYATYVIGSTDTTLDVSVSTDRLSYSGGQTVSVTARASAGGSPVSNASVTFTVTKANGSVVSQTATTNSAGSAVGKFRLKKQDPAGGYRARADAAKSPLSGSADTSFTVVK